MKTFKELYEDLNDNVTSIHDLNPLAYARSMMHHVGMREGENAANTIIVAFEGNSVQAYKFYHELSPIAKQKFRTHLDKFNDAAKEKINSVIDVNIEPRIFDAMRTWAIDNGFGEKSLEYAEWASDLVADGLSDADINIMRKEYRKAPQQVQNKLRELVENLPDDLKLHSLLKVIYTND